jgi:phospholipid-binding lipoprotein MlaA
MKWIAHCIAVFALSLLPALPGHAHNHADSEVSGLEAYNRAVFEFNDGIDQRVFKPFARLYRRVTPDIVERGVGNFFSNIREIAGIPNALLQGKLKKAAQGSGRFLVNSSIGLLGTIDVADRMGLEKQDVEDLGQTLGYWGVPAGPYLQIPFLGPSTLRDFPSGIAVSAFADPLLYLEDPAARNSLIALGLVDSRASLLQAESLITGDKYSFIKSVYLQQREYQVHDGDIDDSFLDDDFDLEAEQ